MQGIDDLLCLILGYIIKSIAGSQFLESDDI
jgi:hypothetical protein